MIQLSVNVNKIATVRNSRGGRIPSLTAAVRTCLEAGAPGITVHPRADERHVRRADVPEVAAEIAAWRAKHTERVEFNIEGDPRPDFVEMVIANNPDQCTLVPVMPGEVTSQAGWRSNTPAGELTDVVKRLQAFQIRVSLFVEPDKKSIQWAKRLGADRVELYTEPFARAYEHDQGGAQARKSFDRYAAAAAIAHSLGLGVNAGHDLDLENLKLFRTLPHLAEVSIGHALVSHALWVGLDRSVRDYLRALAL